jgi:signal transduction histidine kinase
MSTQPQLPQTAPLYHCPQCRTPVRAGDKICPACGVNLALAAVLAERQTLASQPTGAASGRADLPRFGEFLVREGYLSPGQLQTGLTRQREAATMGSAKTIGQVLLEMGVVTRDQLEVAGIQQVKQLQAALEENNRQLEARVTERTQALQVMLNKFAELEEVKANFVANISHELRTPLVPIRGYSDLLLSRTLGPLNASQHDAMDAISRSTRRLEALINELIQFASSVKGKMVINPTVIVVGDLTEPLWDYFGPRAAAGGVTLRQELPEGLPMVRADAEKVYWVLFQLMDNAVKFTPEGGWVFLRAEARPPCVRISVSDTGVGIPPEQLRQIFQPFHQAPAEAGQVVDGTGLGLALVKRIVEAHDSKVEVSSRPKQGSTFAFDLPIATPGAT